jgi:hypothetical protein
VAAVTATALLALSIVGVGTVSAATPNWSMDDVVLLPSTVQAGDSAGYSVTIHNAGPSNISQLYVIAYASTNPVYSVTTQGTCTNPTGSLFCSVGPLRANSAVTITAAFPTPSTGATSFSVTFEANTTGATTSDGGTSHGDVINKTGTTSLSSDANFAGRFVYQTSQLTVQNGQDLGAGNKQATKVVAPVTAIPVTVQDGAGYTPPDLVACNLGSAVCGNLFGEWSSVSVDNGKTFGATFSTYIKFATDLIPSGVNKNNFGVYHQYLDPATDTIKQEAISAACTTKPTSPVPCIVLTTSKTFWQVEIRSYHNGGSKFY